MSQFPGECALLWSATHDQKEHTMAAAPNVDWNAVIADPRFQSLHRKKQGFLTGLMVFSVAFYFLLPIGAAYFQELFSRRVWGAINLGLVFALSEFVVAWMVAFYYSRRAGGEFDRLAREIAADYETGKVKA
jgi:uncharacterized membrane protein (DUF485 family)